MENMGYDFILGGANMAGIAAAAGTQHLPTFQALARSYPHGPAPGLGAGMAAVARAADMLVSDISMIDADAAAIEAGEEVA